MDSSKNEITWKSNLISFKSISPAGVDESVSVADHLTIDTFMPICYNYLTKARKEDALCSTF